MSHPELLGVLRDKSLAPPPPALVRLSAAFDLGPFEQRLVMLAYALETDCTTAGLLAQATGDREVSGLPLAIAHAAIGEQDWHACSPLAPLRRWQIMLAAAPAPRSLLRLRLAESVTDAMLGLAGLDSALETILSPLEPNYAAPRELSEEVATAMAHRSADGLSPVLLGRWPGGATVAAAIAAQLGLRPYRLDAARLAANRDRLPLLKRLWERDLAITAALPIADEPDDPDSSAALAEFCSGLASHVIIVGDTAPAGMRRAVHRIVRGRPAAAQVASLWHEALGDAASAKLNGSVDRAVAHFDLAPDAIVTAASRARVAIETAPDEATAERALWEACGRAAWPEPGPLARVLEPRARWDDLVVPDGVRGDLRAIVRQVRHSATVYERWGFGSAAVHCGRGILALFAGPSGTGKTLASEVIAAELRLPLVRADFSQLQSKWVGETPKLVGRLFDQLEGGGAVLVIDEADGLIGRRGAVVEAHDRHSNVEVAYFLQRLEAFRGLAILTTNLKTAIDDAFFRRFRFVVDFPMPGVVERRDIWRRVFPPNAPLKGVDHDLLAKLPLAGGAIRNVALNAAFLAAEAELPIGQAHIVDALRVEYRKLERSFSEIEIGVLQ